MNEWMNESINLCSNPTNDPFLVILRSDCDVMQCKILLLITWMTLVVNNRKNHEKEIHKWHQHILSRVGWASLQMSWCGHNGCCLQLHVVFVGTATDIFLTTIHKHAMGYVIEMLPSHFVSIVASECFTLFTDNNIDTWSRNRFLTEKNHVDSF